MNQTEKTQIQQMLYKADYTKHQSNQLNVGEMLLSKMRGEGQ